MAVIHNKHDYQFPETANVGDILVSTANNDIMVMNQELEWVIAGQKTGKPMAISVLEEFLVEQDLEAKYPALKAAREQYNIIKALCQEAENEQ